MAAKFKARAIPRFIEDISFHLLNVHWGVGGLSYMSLRKMGITFEQNGIVSRSKRRYNFCEIWKS